MYYFQISIGREKIMKKIISLSMILILCIAVEVVKADFTFGPPIPVPNVNSKYVDGGPRISADNLTLFFVSSRPGWGEDDWDLWVSTRAHSRESWTEPQNLGSTVNSSVLDGGPSISTDGLTLYFFSNRPGGYGDWDIWVTTRATLEDEWQEPKNVGPTVNTSAFDYTPTLSYDGLTLYFCSNRSSGLDEGDFWVARRSTVDDVWDPAENLGPPISSQYDEWTSHITADGLTFFFTDAYPNRPFGFGKGDLWVSRRLTISDTWSEPVNLGASINSSSDDGGVSISADGSTIYFHSNRPGGQGDYDIWQASIEPIVDLNGDGIIDAEDMCIIVDNWETDDSLCDIGPMPWGDGIVDVQDLIVLAEHLFEEIPTAEPVE
jgi:hypothetical protein